MVWSEETKLTCQNQAADLNYVQERLRLHPANIVQAKTRNFDLNLRFIGILDELCADVLLYNTREIDLTTAFSSGY